MEVIVVFDGLVSERLFVQSVGTGCAACEAVWVRRRIVDIVGRLRVVRQLAPNFRWRGGAHAVLSMLIRGRHGHIPVVRRHLAQHCAARLLSRARALAPIRLPSLVSAQARRTYSYAGVGFESTDPGGD
jgi:hypothetical protein